ncbi:MAG TPA: hypothetical protein VH415_02600, partial [Nitrososphaeraceae archaeon]
VAIKDYLSSKRLKLLFFIFLLIFETMFIMNWYNPCSPSGLCMNIDYDISGPFIAIAVIPVGTLLIFSFFAGPVLLTRYLAGRGWISVLIFDPDKMGGLKPIGNLILMSTLLLSVGIFLTFILHPTYYFIQNGLPYVGLTFLGIDLFLFVYPQSILHKLLAKLKEDSMQIIQEKIEVSSERLRKATDAEDKEEMAQYSEKLSNYKNIREEIERLGVYPFDWNILKVIIPSILSIVTLIIKATIFNT